ncbi:2-amino-4-hydroxy-6-hydroxymethyldihydropteridine diphosphokinase [Gallionella capsiferriformans]|uniref:2-amino-4-hydroxy-6-hydroxymethyldihydropteridine pyrophosphokinase n=1 Tax=Gallionella capsiferriformans (strain ES-2) TaxID=395494 RepID=D9SIJ2_GALCS|nr:2-amino-4-hydroxy-6-hydroxymethyldihydropteridine diphosphokinase [Gallionella capsiferriformans]ADL56155.1 2-amino-4-hydroxy-6-hydroxymethyldihydropteridine pyrophosphokinase [Gallionella capsiferriformans ES-2]
MTRQVCFIGLGSNLGESREQLRCALADIDALPDTRVMVCSSFYRSAPVGFLDQPDFLNAVAKITTRLAPHALLDALLHIEQRYGRERVFQNAPRTLDLDVLLYGELKIQESGLTIPHPQMHLRAFVLQPLLEIEPGCLIPAIGQAEYAMRNCLDQVLEKLEN